MQATTQFELWLSEHGDRQLPSDGRERAAVDWVLSRLRWERRLRELETVAGVRTQRA